MAGNRPGNAIHAGKAVNPDTAIWLQGIFGDPLVRADTSRPGAHLCFLPWGGGQGPTNTEAGRLAWRQVPEAQRHNGQPVPRWAGHPPACPSPVLHRLYVVKPFISSRFQGGPALEVAMPHRLEPPHCPPGARAGWFSLLCGRGFALIFGDLCSRFFLLLPRLRPAQGPLWQWDRSSKVSILGGGLFGCRSSSR